MAHHPADRPVRITGEERLHPALRKLGRACIALARWQREQQRPSEAPPDDAAPHTGTGTTTTTPTVPAPEPRHD